MGPKIEPFGMKRSNHLTEQLVCDHLDSLETRHGLHP